MSPNVRQMGDIKNQLNKKKIGRCPIVSSGYVGHGMSDITPYPA